MLKQRIVFCLAVAVLFLSSLLGGGQGFFGDVLAQLAAVFLLAACLFNEQSELKTASRFTRSLSFSFVAIVIFVPLFQLYPWPSTGEYALSMQGDLQDAGITLAPFSFNKTYGAERALSGLLPACAIFLACLQLPNRFRYRLLAALAIILFLNILLGFAQLAQGKTSALRLYEITNVTEAVGFFANRNHFAGMLMMCLPVSVAVTAWCLHRRASGIRIPPLYFIGGGLFCILMLLAIAVARSRAGLLLALVGMALSLPALYALPRRPGMKRMMTIVLLLGAVVSIQFGLAGILQRFDRGVGDSTRTEMTRISIEAGKAYAPLGSGLGTFRQAYAPFEAKHEASIEHTVTNHAHNDYAELWLEAGYPALLAIAAFWVAFAILGFRVWLQQKQDASFDVLLSRVAWIGVLLMLLHSFADYPLRTTANTGVFALLLAIALACSRQTKPS